MHRRVLLKVRSGKHAGLTIIGGTEIEIRPTKGTLLPPELTLPVHLPGDDVVRTFKLTRQDPHSVRYEEVS